MRPSPALAHPWDLPPDAARALQERLRARVRIEPLPSPIRVVGGVDVSVKQGVARAAVVLLSSPGMEPLEAATAEMEVAYPYVPGLLAFREGPVVMAALARLEGQPDVLIFDGQGVAHPRRMGLAAHIGLLLDWPSVGCAKSRLLGRHRDVPPERGSWVELLEGEEVIGVVLRTRTNVRPVYVSVGHRADLGTAVELVLSCCTRYRLPEPIRWAHRVAGGERFP